MKIKKKQLRETLLTTRKEDEEGCTVSAGFLRSLIREALKHRKLRKRLKPLRRECAFLSEYVEGDDENFNSDRLSKYEHAVQEAAITAILGDEFYTDLDEKLK